MDYNNQVHKNKNKHQKKKNKGKKKKKGGRSANQNHHVDNSLDFYENFNLGAE